MSEQNAPVVVTDGNFEDEVLKSELPVLVDFWAPWCAPCHMVSPVVEEVASEYNGKLKVAKVNTDENQNRAGELGIRGIPTLILFNKGEEVDRVVGAVPKPTIAALVEKAIS